MQKHIFRKYDIRGIVGLDFDVDQIYDLTQAILDYYEEKSLSIQRIAVAFDGRLYSEELYQQVSLAIIDRGYQVYFLGICPTPVFVYGLHHLPVQAGIMITGCSDKKEYNGFKLYFEKEIVWGNDIEKIYHNFITPKMIKKIENKGKIVPCSIVDQYIESLWQEFAHLSQYDFSIVIDCASGSTGLVIRKLIQKMSWKQVRSIFDTVDGSFPYHDPDPTLVENMHLLHEEVLKRKHSFGIGFDGDGSSIIGLEENGNLILGDRMLALFAKDILINFSHRSVVFDSKCSYLVQDVIELNHGKAVLSTSGIPHIKNTMEKNNAILGGEMFGHYFFKDRHVGYNDSIYSLLRMLDLLVKEKKSIYELLINLSKNQIFYEKVKQKTFHQGQL